MNPSTLTTTGAVDPVFFYIFGISAVMLIGITIVMLVFIVRYRRSVHPHPEATPTHNYWLESVWTILPTLIVISMFWYGWEGYTTLSNVPKDAFKVEVIGRKWAWEFRYPNGRSSEKLVVPVGRAIALDMTSEDVLHSFYLPAFRVKRDTVPGMTTHLWFRAPVAGSYDAFCAEYCGTGHSAMITTVEALPEHQFEEWYASESPREENAEGRQLLASNGCTGCHSLDGKVMVGPTFKDLFGRQVTVVTDGKERTLSVDEDYLRRAILEPNADLVKGYPAAMPSYQGRLSDHDLETIINYFKGSSGAAAGSVETGRKLAAKLGCAGCHSTDGSRRVGPTFKGIFGRPVEVKTAGEERTVTADAAYLKRSIKDPQADLVDDYPPVMPPFPNLSEEELQALVDYLRSLQ
ncbi:cytochrome c oxidase subunit II [Desulfuromonas carbonis]|uniref:cytochrome c oxidase subunit II n=1 Tax=Desulfuromonas sp. DDH964 TaxID=1823759 RepID=UPI00078EE1F7|nr:cytochrome c oxidase subunit II [Desulfuromonas sp. DDH964]AMV73319.1 cytochrome c oxidase, coo3-type, cytochrome c subunit II, one heme-binding site [Desulfuromonas sp. DDH964]